MFIGCIRCHGPTDRNRNCPICDAKEFEMSNFNDLPEDEQVQEMGKSAPNYQNRVAAIVPTKTDADFAAEIKQRIIKAYEPLFEIMQEADKRGFGIQAQTGKDFAGRFNFAQLQVIKVY